LPRWLAFAYAGMAAGTAAALALAGERAAALFCCPWRHLTGLPCPTCGGTHAALALARLDVTGAWRENPLVTAAAAMLLIWAAASVAMTLVPRWRIWIELSARERRWLRLAALVALLGGWAYKLATR
jgi:hypothetical protein